MEMTARSAAILLLTCTVGLVQGCASSWHSDAAATPVTYRLPESRIGRGVGNLKRLVVLPVVYDGGIIASFSRQTCATQQDWLKETFILFSSVGHSEIAANLGLMRVSDE